MPKELNKYIVLASIVTAVVTLVTYIENKKYKKMQGDLMQLDKEIKTLQLEKLNNG